MFVDVHLVMTQANRIKVLERHELMSLVSCLGE